MPGNVLTATVKVNTQGVKQSFQEVSTATKKTATDFKSFDGFATGAITETRQVIKSLKAEIAGLDATLLNSRGGKALASELQLAKGELKNLEKQANISGPAVSNSLTKGFSALRQLAFILPGIGIAGIINLAFEGISKLLDSLDLLGSKRSIIEDFNNEFAAGAAKSVVGLELLRAKIDDSNTTQAQRVELVKDYNKQADAANKIDLQTSSTIDAINAKIEQQITLLKQRAAVRAAEAILGKKFEDLFNQQLQLDFDFPKLTSILQKATDIVDEANKKLKIQPSFNVKELLQLADQPAEVLNKLAASADKFKALTDKSVVDQLKTIRQQLKDFNNEASGAGKKFKLQIDTEGVDKAQQSVDDLLKQFGRLLTVPGFSEEDKGKVKKLFEGISAAFVEGSKDFVHTLELNPNKLSLPFQIVIDENKLTTQFSFLNEQLRAKLHEFELKVSSVPLVIKQQIEVDPNLKLPAGLRKEMEDELKAQFGNAPVKFDVDIEGKLTAKTDVAQVLRELETALINITRTFGNDIAANIGNVLGDALSGKDLGDGFRQFGKILSDGLASIGKAMIAAGVKILIAKQAISKLFANPAFSIAAGIALIALSKVLANSIGREKGGPVSRGKLYEVNERGRELFQPTGGKPMLITGGRQFFTPPTSGKIIPNWQTEKILRTASLGKVKQSIFNSFGAISGHRAGGGAVVAGNNYIVNERGREIFIPNTGQAINVNQPSGNFARGGISVFVTGAMELSGNKIVAVIANTQRTQKVFV